MSIAFRRVVRVPMRRPDSYCNLVLLYVLSNRKIVVEELFLPLYKWSNNQHWYLSLSGQFYSEVRISQVAIYDSGRY